MPLCGVRKLKKWKLAGVCVYDDHFKYVILMIKGEFLRDYSMPDEEL